MWRAISTSVSPSANGASSLGLGSGLWATIQTLCFRGVSFLRGQEGDSSSQFPAWTALWPHQAQTHQTRARGGTWVTACVTRVLLSEDHLPCTPSKPPAATSASHCFCPWGDLCPGAQGKQASWRRRPGQRDAGSDEIRAPCAQRHGDGNRTTRSFRTGLPRTETHCLLPRPWFQGAL